MPPATAQALRNGLGLLGLGLGMAMTYWVVPGLLMGAGGFLVGLALPLCDEHANR